MDGISCDLCGAGLLIQSDVRYEVRIDVRAAYDPLEITREDLKRDLRAEIDDLIERIKGMSPEELERQVHAAFRFDLCPACQKRYVRDPLRRSPEKPA